MRNYLKQLKERKSFIIIGDFYQDVAREVICDAYHLKMTAYEVLLENYLYRIVFYNGIFYEIHFDIQISYKFDLYQHVCKLILFSFHITPELSVVPPALVLKRLV